MCLAVNCLTVPRRYFEVFLSVMHLFLCVLTAIFSRGPVLAGTKMSTFLILLELRVMEVVVAPGAVNRRANLQSNRYHQQSNTQLFYTPTLLSCRSTNSVKALSCIYLPIKC